MATESQFRAVIEALAQAAKDNAVGVTLVAWPNGSGHICRADDTGGNRVRWYGSMQAVPIIGDYGIPIDPDPPEAPADNDCMRRQEFIDVVLKSFAQAFPGAKPSYLTEKLDEILEVRARAFEKIGATTNA